MSSKSSQRGFTIVELMIATAVFSTILMVILTAVTTVGRMYYKGITNARTQEATRTITDRIAQEIQYSGSAAGSPLLASGSTSGTKAVCVGNSRYFYKINQVATGNNHGVWYDTSGAAGCTNAVADSVNMSSATPTVGGSEILPDGARIVAFNVTQGANNLWSINVKVVFGADDLLDTSDGSPQATSPALTICKGSQIGTQFCAISELSTTVLKRVP